MRRLAMVLLLLASTAHAQSDNRKLALWTLNGHRGSTVIGDYWTNGNKRATTTGQISECHQILVEMLDRMGVPYTTFNFFDSTGGWKDMMGGTRPAGVADSTWFRQNGYFGQCWCQTDMEDVETLEPFKLFTDAGSNRGKQTGSPTDGNWGTPTVIFTPGADRNAGQQFENGNYNAFYNASSGQLDKSALFDNGDTLNLGAANLWNVDPSQSANVTKLITAGDTLTSGGSSVLSYKWKNSTYWYYIPSATRPATALLGLAQLFKSAGYTPRRKLNLHMTLDHVHPLFVSGATTAPFDTLLTYARRGGWRFSGAIQTGSISPSIERSGIDASLKNLAIANKDLWASTVHSHSDLTFSNGSGAPATNQWNLTTFADTATQRARYNYFHQTITDTLGLKLAQGYERTGNFPGDYINYKQFYMWIQDGFTDVRAPGSDSVGWGDTSDLLARGALTSGWTKSSTTELFMSRPWVWADPASRKTIWVHDEMTHPGSTAQNMSGVTEFDLANNTDGKAALNLQRLARAIIWDTDFYWHPNDNLEGDQFMSIFFRRWTYFLNRISNICTFEPSYRTKVPRRHNNPRS